MILQIAATDSSTLFLKPARLWLTEEALIELVEVDDLPLKIVGGDREVAAGGRGSLVTVFCTLFALVALDPFATGLRTILYSNFRGSS